MAVEITPQSENKYTVNVIPYDQVGGDIISEAKQTALLAQEAKDVSEQSATTASNAAQNANEAADRAESSLQILSVATVEALGAVNRRNLESAVVRDTDRGGNFTYKPSTDNLTVDNGVIFPAQDGGYWVRQFSGAVNVKWFGAKGDGSNATTAFTSAIASLKNRGGTLFVPNGTYSISTVLTIDFSNFTLKGQSRDGVVFNCESNLFLLQASTSSGMSNIVLSGFTANAVSRRIIAQFTDSPLTDLRVNDVRINHSGSGHAIYFGDHTVKGNERFYFDNVEIWMDSTYSYCLAIRKPLKGLWVTNCIMSNVNALSYNNLAIYADTNDFHVIGNTFYGGGHSPIACSPAHNGEIIGNIVELTQFNNLFTEGGIEIEWKDGHLGVDTSHDITVSNNLVSGYTRGIFVEERDQIAPAPGIPYNITISNNIITDCFLGVALLKGKHVTVTGNVISKGTTGDSNGVYVAPGMSQTIVNNNIIKSVNRGVYVDHAKDIMVSGNLMDKLTSNGVRVNGAEFLILKGNKINADIRPGIRFEYDASHDVTVEGNCINAQNVGILFDPSIPAKCERVTISGNELTSPVGFSAITLSAKGYIGLKLISNRTFGGRCAIVLADSSDCEIIGNDLDSSLHSSNAITIAAGSNDVVCSLNKIKLANGYGIFIFGAGNHIDVHSNKINGGLNAIRVENGGKLYSIQKNTVKNTSSSAIVFESGIGNYQINDNMVTNNGGGHGISVKVNNCLVQGNYVSENAGNKINDTGTGNIVQNNF